MNYKSLKLLTTLSFLLTITYCDPNYFGRTLTRNSSIDPDNVVEKPIDCPPGADCSKTYTSNVATWTLQNLSQSTAADFVFIIDKSGSMADNIKALSDSIVGWMTTLDNLNLPNYCLSVLQGISNNNVGELIQVDGKSCFCRNEMNIPDIQASFKIALNKAPVGSLTASMSLESNLYPIHRALTDKLALNQASGSCLRNDSAFVAIPVTDENEAIMSAIDGVGNCPHTEINVGGTSVFLDTVVFNNSFLKYGQNGWTTSNKNLSNYQGPDAACYEVRERLRFVNPVPDIDGKYVNLFTPQTIIDDIKNYNGNLPTTGGVIAYAIGSNADFTSSRAEGYAHGYYEFLDLLGKDIIDITVAVPAQQPQFNTLMTNFAEELVADLSFQRVFNLVNAAGTSVEVCEGEEDSVSVKVNATTLETSKYSLSTDRTKITVLPSVNLGENDQVKIGFVTCN